MKHGILRKLDKNVSFIGKIPDSSTINFSYLRNFVLPIRNCATQNRGSHLLHVEQ